MSDISILDTGYPSVIKSGTKESGNGNISNSGNAITLKTSSVRYSRGVGVDDTPSPGAFGSSSDTETNLSTIENPKLVIRGVLDRSSTSDMDKLGDLDDLARTKGMKLFYYDSTSDGYRDITDSLNIATDNQSDTHTGSGNELSASTPHLHVRVIGFEIEHASSGLHLIWTLNLIVDGG